LPVISNWKGSIYRLCIFNGKEAETATARARNIQGQHCTSETEQLSTLETDSYLAHFKHSKPQVNHLTTPNTQPSISHQNMCRSYTIVYTNCGHSVHHPDLCPMAQQRRPITACHGWKNPMRETFQGEDEDCPTCQDTRTLRITQEPWTNRNNGEDVPIRLRRDSLSQRYVPTPPPVYTSRYDYGSGYGYAEEAEERRAGDPDPSPREVYRRVADWADRVPVPHAPPGSANTRREMELYRPREQDHSRRVGGSSSRHSAVGSQVSRSSTRRRDIYDVHHDRHRHPKTEDSSHSSYYLRASDEERRSSLPARRRGYPPSLVSAAHAHDDYELSETRISFNPNGAEVIRTSTWRLEYQQPGQSTQAENTGNTEKQNRRVGANHDASVRRGQSNHSGSGYVAYSRGPQSSPSQSHRRMQ
jgi:hypothetical protein